jgi:hypothetical protein
MAPIPRKLTAAALCALLGAAGLAAGCGDEKQAAPASPAAAAEWAWLQSTQRELTARRARLAAAGAGDQAAAQALRRETGALAAELNRRLVELINADPPVEGEPLTERQKAALRMKSDEDVLLARDFVARGGDYQRALDILREALAVDPENPRLKAELAATEARRYMPQATFAKVKEGMDQEEVRKLLGQPNLHNVREYPGYGVVGWFYPKNASGAAAAVWFARAEGRHTVYLADFNAIQPGTQGKPAQPPRKPAAPSPQPTSPQPLS